MSNHWKVVIIGERDLVLNSVVSRNSRLRWAMNANRISVGVLTNPMTRRPCQRLLGL
jgi:hypothetical protein